MLSENKHYNLFSLGPNKVSRRVQSALLHPPICHRDDDFTELLSSVRKKLLRLFRGSRNHTVVVFTGSGTASIEAAISSAIRRGTLLVLGNGDYSEKMASIARIHGIETIVQDFGFGKTIELDQIERQLKERTDIQHVALIHHEASTGMLNPIKEIGDLCKRYGKTYLVDAVASLGVEELDVDHFNIDFCIGTNNKPAAIAPPGLSFVCANKERIKELKGLPPRTSYLDLWQQYDYEENRGQCPFTPSLPLFYALDVGLDEVLEEGVENRGKRYRLCAEEIRNGLKSFGYRFLIDEGMFSSVLTAVLTPKSVSYADLHRDLKSRGYIIYHGLGPAHLDYFRIANTGWITDDEIRKFLDSFRVVLLDRKCPKVSYA